MTGWRDSPYVFMDLPCRPTRQHSPRIVRSNPRFQLIAMDEK